MNFFFITYLFIRIKTSPIPDILLIGPTEFSLNKANFKYFQLKSYPSNYFKTNKKCTITIQCLDLHSHDTTSLSMEIIIKNSDIQATGDPHIMQRVFDHREKVLKMICYDISGKSGDVIFLVKDLTKEKLSVYGKLLDDYYMHIVKLTSNFGNITLTTEKIIFPDGEVLEWNSYIEDRSFLKNKFFIKLKKNLIFITKAQIFSNRNTNLRVTVRRSHRIVTGYFLDVIFQGLNEQYTQIDGLLGRIGKNRFTFYESVQDVSVNSRISININGRIGTGKIERRDGTDCWLINVKDALYPSSVDDFIFSQPKLF